MNISYVNKIDPAANGQQPDYKDLNLKFNMWNPAYDTSGYRPAGNAINSLMHGPWSDPQDSKGYTYTDLMGRKYAMDGSDEAQQAARDAQIADFASSERRGGSFLGNPVMQERLKFEDQLRNSMGGKQAKRSSDDEDGEEQPAKPDIRERVKQILYGDNDYNRNWVASANRGDALNKAPVDNPHGGSTNPNMVKAYLASDQRQKDIEEAKKYQEYLKYLEYQKQLAAAQAAQAAQQQRYSAPPQAAPQADYDYYKDEASAYKPSAIDREVSDAVANYRSMSPRSAATTSRYHSPLQSIIQGFHPIETWSNILSGKPAFDYEKQDTEHNMFNIY